MKKMIVLDLDGTLLNQSQSVSKYSKEYLKRLKKQGFIITIATGRILKSALCATKNARFANYIISSTGSFCYNIITGKTIFKNTISKEIVKRVFSYYENCLFIDVCDKNMIYKYSDVVREHRSYVTTMQNRDYILNTCKEVNHISIVMKNNQYVLELYPKLIKEFPNLEVMLMQDSFGEKKWIELCPKGCTKYKAIQKLAESLQIETKDIITFGDGLNDIEMIENCGMGIAMQNALVEVKEVADKVTEYPNTEDGVVRFLEEHFDEI